MEFGKVSSCKHVTIDDLRAIEKYAHLTEPEAETLLSQIKDLSHLIYKFTQKQANE